MKRKSILSRILDKKIDKWVVYYFFLFCILILGFALTSALNASELVDKFGSRSFNGQGQSAHYLTIDEQERTRKLKIYEDAQDILEDAEREADNTVLAKFIRNLESRIYSTLAKDISESLFSYGTTPTADNPVMGTINLEENVLTWINDGTTITLIIEEYLDGVLVSTTEIVIPVGNFGGCWAECDG